MRLFFISLLFLSCSATPDNGTMNENKINYVALGDSYTICEGAKATEQWPTILASHLTEKGIKTEMVANPSRTGWTTQDLIDNELPVFDGANADFVTLCIGVNDWVQGVDKKIFAKNLQYILDHVQKKLKDKSKIIVLTIPDFSASTVGPMYANGRDISAGIKEFNDVILAEAKKRNLKTVDLFEPSLKMKTDKSLEARDGLHPSAKEYAIWEKLILPVATELLK
ncbi:MAG TPA: SGNH/GDSL hydrolase family protein [Flavobacteriales bacterium]|nr:SGNH/GDSL hydrolase family protein [Flavobacteriales bacterium]